MATSVVFPRVQFFANNGRPLIGGRIHTFVAGSSTRARTYTDAAQTQANTNPVVLDARGEAAIYLIEGLEYKFVVEDWQGAMIMTQEPVYGAIWPNASEWPSDATLSFQYMTEALAAASAIGPIKFYDTYAAAAADVGSLAEGDIVEVAQDETRAGSRTRYKKASGILSFVVDLDRVRLELAAPGGSDMVGHTADESVGDALNQVIRPSVFGRSGMRVIVGEKDDAHCGWGGVTAFPSGKWVFVYRRAPDHAILDYAELRARDSYDGGATWVNDRLVAAPGPHDVRPDPPRLMANNRMGFFVNRQDEGTVHYSPWFITTDDEGATFQAAVVPTASPYTFQGHSGLMDFPASQGGHDTLGFVSYGYLSAGGIDAFCTSDNGNTWTQVQDVGVASGAIVSISETIGVRIGTQDKWLFYARASDSAGWHQQMTVFATTNMLSWGAARDSGLELGGNPPGGLYDPASGRVHILNFSRGPTRSIDGTEQSLMNANAPGEALYAANGVFSALGIGYKELAVVPYWATGYIAPFRVRGGWYATFTCGEPGVSGNAHSVEVLVGNFTSSATDMTQIVHGLLKRQRQIRSIDIVTEDNSPTNWPIYIHNQANTATHRIGAYSSFHVGGGSPYVYQSDVGFVYTAPYSLFGGLTAPISGQLGAVQVGVQGVTIPAIVTYVGSTSNRKNLVFRNQNGEVGSINTNDSSTGFNTTSDETLKDFDGEMDAQAAIDVIRADPVRRFRWKASGTAAVGWGAQTSYTVSKDLATPGGWFDPEGEPCDETAPGAVYVPWGVDQSKRTPYLWAAVAHLLDRVEALEAQLAGGV